MSKRDPRVLLVFASIFAVGMVWAISVEIAPVAGMLFVACLASAGEALYIKLQTDNSGNAD